MKRMLQLAKQRPRFGYRRIGRLLRAEGWQASDTRGLSLVAPSRAESASKEAEKATFGQQSERL